jgi:hypothetical protein
MPQLIMTVNTLHDKAVHATDKAEQLWISLGIELKEAKERNKESGKQTWEEFAKEHFDFGRSRADELIQIADGRTTVDKVRAGGAARAAKNMAKLKSAVSNGGSSKALVPADERRDAPSEDPAFLRENKEVFIDGRKQWMATTAIRAALLAGKAEDWRVIDYDIVTGEMCFLCLRCGSRKAVDTTSPIPLAVASVQS